MNKFFKSHCILFLLSFGWLNAQERHYLIRLKDKNNNPYTIQNPSQFLGLKAINRRAAQGISLNEKDLPVNPQYVNAIQSLGAVVRCRLKWSNSVLVSTNQATFNSILQLPFVNGGQPVRRSRADNPVKINQEKKGIQMTINDVADVSNSQTSMLAIDTMLAEGYNGAGKIIAVMDAGFRNINNHIAMEHLYNSGRILGVWDLVANDNSVTEDHQHGAEVLSNIAAYHPAELIAGGHGASYYLFRTETVAEEYELEPVLLSRAVEMADSLGVDIINISLGYNTFDDPSQDYNINQLDGYTTISSYTLSEGAKRGMVIVTSAGNYGANQSWSMRITTPADADSILAVGAVFATGERAGFSSTGPTADGRIKPDVVAQGVANKVINVNTTAGYSLKNGTSFAAPTVTGLVAGFWQAFPSLTAKEVVEIIKQSGLKAYLPDNQIGYGIPNYNRAKSLVGIRKLLQKAEPLLIVPNPGRQKSFEIKLPSQVGEVEIELIHASGKKIYHTKANAALAHHINLSQVSLPVGQYYVIVRVREAVWSSIWLYQP